MEHSDHSFDAAIDMAVPESWMAYGITTETAKMISEGFPDFWLKAVATHHPDHARNIAQEMAHQSRAKNLEQVASATLPTPYLTPSKKTPSRMEQLLNQFQEKHYPDTINRPPANPFRELWNDTPKDVPVSAESWRDAAHSLATTLLESGKRVAVTPKPTPAQVPAAKDPVDEPIRLPLYETATDERPLPQKPKTLTEPPKPVKPRPTQLGLATYPGRFEWDFDEGRYVEK